MTEGEAFQPFIKWDDLLKPIEPPRQPYTELPSRADLCRELRRAGALLNGMAGFVEAAPFADDSFNALDAQVADALRMANVALFTFRGCRDARGSA